MSKQTWISPQQSISQCAPNQKAQLHLISDIFNRALVCAYGEAIKPTVEYKIWKALAGCCSSNFNKNLLIFCNHIQDDWTHKDSHRNISAPF